MDHAQTLFSPQRNGFRFINRFENPFSLQYPLPFAGQVDLSKIVIGLCGGMCFAALDYFYANRDLPDEADVTRLDRRLFTYLCQRQIDSLQIPVVLRIIESMLSEDRQLIARVTRSELPKIRRLLDKGQPAVICLIRVRGLGDPSQNHQVLVTGYQVNPQTRETVLALYDPNHPEETPTISICKENGRASGYRLEQSTGEALRGFFLVPYKPVKTLPRLHPAIPTGFIVPPAEGATVFRRSARPEAAEAVSFGVEAEGEAVPFRLSWPVDSQRVNQGFNENPQWYLPFNLPGHEGLDLYAITNANVYAAAEGEVYMAEHPDGHPYGLQIRIRHPFHGRVYHTIYAHLSKLLVRSGQKVNAGDLIGLADNTGNSFGSHLHLTLKLDGAQTPGYPPGIIDPWPYLQAGVIEEEDEDEHRLRPPGSGILVYTTAGLNLRDAPSLGGKILGSIPAGEALDALGDAEAVRAKIGKPGEWLHVKTASGQAGFVSAPFVVSSEQADFPPTDLVVYPIDALNLRAGPGTGFDVLAGLNVTDPLTILGDGGTASERIGKQGEWLHVQTAAGLRGFVAAWLVRQTGETPPPTDLVVFATATLNVRARPTMDSNVLTTATPEDKLAVLGDRAQAQARIGRMDQWLNVRTPAGFTGYVAAWLVRSSPLQPDNIPATLTVRPTADVNMRAQPSLGAPRVSGAFADEQLKVIEADLVAARAKIGLQDKWLFVEKADGTRGWVAAWFMVERL